MNEPKRVEKKQKTNLVSTVFGDGMVVNAEDLTTAAHYPIALFQTLIRAYFGCGIVCGLKVHRHPEESQKTLCVKVEPGVALDCHGFPLQLCEAMVFDFTPDPCDCKTGQELVCIAISRCTIGEGQREDGDSCCDKCSQPRCENRRARDWTRVATFNHDDLPENLCARPEYGDDGAVEAEELSQWLERLCPCLKECPECCGCCGESWVLLGCFVIDYDACNIIDMDPSRRKYIKPIACFCPPETAPTSDDVVVTAALQTATPIPGRPKKPTSRKKKTT